MKKENKIILLLLVLPAMTGELLTGRTPPMEFLNPLALLFFIPLYGFSLLLIREAKACWKMQWSTTMLCIAFSVLYEGLIIKSFFNPGWEELGRLSNYGAYFGLQMPYTLMAVIFHSTMSMMIPLLIVEMLWPECKDKTLLGRKGKSIAFAGVISAAMIGYAFFGTLTEDGIRPFYPEPLLTFIIVVAICLLLWFAYDLRRNKLSTYDMVIWKPIFFGLAGFLFQAFNLFIPNSLAGLAVGGGISIVLQSLLTLGFLLFLYYQFAHQNAAKKHVVAFVCGSYLFYILIAPFQEVSNHISGMIIIALLSILLLYIWAHSVLSRRTSY